jgi:hypothetical protein
MTVAQILLVALTVLGLSLASYRSALTVSSRNER